jgi:hypothetical protein
MEQNYLDRIDELGSIELINLIGSILNAYKAQGLEKDFDTYALEKPWKFPEIWIPALDRNLSDYFTGDKADGFNWWCNSHQGLWSRAQVRIVCDDECLLADYSSAGIEPTHTREQVILGLEI